MNSLVGSLELKVVTRGQKGVAKRVLAGENFVYFPALVLLLGKGLRERTSEMRTSRPWDAAANLMESAYLKHLGGSTNEALGPNAEVNFLDDRLASYFEFGKISVCSFLIACLGCQSARLPCLRPAYRVRRTCLWSLDAPLCPQRLTRPLPLPAALYRMSSQDSTP